MFGDDEEKIIEIKVYAKDYSEKLSSVLDLDGRLGAYDLKDDFGQFGAAFRNPKPVRLISQFLPFVARNDGDIVLDFFAGSATTAKATLRLNEKDGIRRRFIMVQLPEPLDPDQNEHKLAVKFCDFLGKPRNIAELTKERIRRASARLKEANPMFGGDLGFRVFKLDTSNIQPWDPDPDNVRRSLLESADHVKPDRSEADVLFEVLLKLGLELTVPIEARAIAGKEVHSIGAGALFVCLARKIARQEVEPLALGIAAWHHEQNPAGETQVVFRDSAFADDVAKTNLAAILQQHGLATVRSL